MTTGPILNTQNGGCTFCQIVARKKRAHIVYEDKLLLTIVDKHPINEGHVLVIPKKHVENLVDLDRPTYTALMLTARTLWRSIDRAYHPKKVGIVVAGWDVPHAHLHVIPMKNYHDITSKSLLDNSRKEPSKGDLEGTAITIRATLKNLQSLGREPASAF